MSQLPIPPHFQPDRTSQIWRVPYQQRASEADAWAQKHKLQSIEPNLSQTLLLLIDVQNTFCLPDFELFVGGRSGRGAIDDSNRICQFIYHNLGEIDQIVATMDTHHLYQIFHPSFWLDPNGEHPAPATIISPEDLHAGKWRANPEFGQDLPEKLQADALHYVERLSDGGKYPLTVWPYHAMLGGIGHALVPAIEEAIFFHGIARRSQAIFDLKGDRTSTEHYSALAPEVAKDRFGEEIGAKNTQLIERLLAADKLIIAGQAQSHCVAWTVSDLLAEIQAIDPTLARKVYLLADCTSPVVIPDLIDYTDRAEAAYDRFAAAGMNIVKSTDSFLNV